ncbi:MAG TPA: hypothetical protein VJ647_01870 [Chitinophagaceae bacterium]|nr:hypothetical protein [Chitinophagaceae bacterium]
MTFSLLNFAISMAAVSDILTIDDIRQLVDNFYSRVRIIIKIARPNR